MDALDILDTAKDRFHEAMDAWTENRDEMLDDLRFRGGDQWPTDVASDRQADGRPCLTINKLPAFIDQVVGDQLMNRPEIKFLPVDGDADPETAELMTGLRRHIEQQSDAEIAYDTAFESAVTCGMGAWRILTEYCDPYSFDQEIRIERIMNRFTVFPDPMAQKWDYSDGQYIFVTEEIDKKVFEHQYPKAVLTDWEGSEHTSEWMQPDSIRVAEYFYKKPVKKTIYQIMTPDGQISGVEKLPDGEEGVDYAVLKERESEFNEVWWCKMTWNEILEGPTKWPGSYIPVVLLWGKELVLDKKRVYSGIVRFAKDPQRLYNYSRSMHAETTALSPKAPYIATPKLLQNHEPMWNTSNKKNWPVLIYNPDPLAPGAPRREMPPQPNQAAHMEIMIADQEIHDTTGLQLAALGKKSNEKSGIAIEARQREGDVGNFSYTNNLARALKYTGKVLLDLIPKVYDAPRIARILGPDGSEKMVPVNQMFLDEKGKPKEHNLSVGKYDVAVTVGPSYTTKRQESMASMVEFVKAMPQIAPSVMDLVVKNMDWPGADEFRDRLEKLLPPGLLDQPPEEQPQQASPPPPDPMVVLKIKQEEAKLQIDLVKLEQEKVQLAVAQMEAQAKSVSLTMDEKQKAVNLRNAYMNPKDGEQTQ